MLRNDSFQVGFLVGIVFPIISWFIFNEVQNILIANEYFPNGKGMRPQFIAILAVLSNLMPFFAYNYSRKIASLKGVTGATILATVIVLIFFRRGFFP